MEEVQARAETDKQWWEKRRASIQTDFMKELDSEAAKAPTAPTTGPSSVVSEDEPVLVDGHTSSAASTPSKKGKK